MSETDTAKSDTAKSGKSKPGPSKRGELIRNTVVFQLKLMADGFRDLLLLPVSLIASLIGLLRGGDEPEREFNQVLEVGLQSEQWINLFGHHEVQGDSKAIASIDTLFTKMEETLKQQYQAGGTSKSAQAEIGKALQAVIEKTQKRQSDDPDSKDSPSSMSTGKNQ